MYIIYNTFILCRILFGLYFFRHHFQFSIILSTPTLTAPSCRAVLSKLNNTLFHNRTQLHPAPPIPTKCLLWINFFITETFFNYLLWNNLFLYKKKAQTYFIVIDSSRNDLSQIAAPPDGTQSWNAYRSSPLTPKRQVLQRRAAAARMRAPKASRREQQQLPKNSNQQQQSKTIYPHIQYQQQTQLQQQA